jgi:hypothetical protein
MARYSRTLRRITSCWAGLAISSFHACSPVLGGTLLLCKFPQGRSNLSEAIAAEGIARFGRAGQTDNRVLSAKKHRDEKSAISDQNRDKN